MRTSPRTSTVTGSSSFSGSPSTVPIACETSSPAVPSPRVISRVSRPSLYRAATASPSSFGPTLKRAASWPMRRAREAVQAVNSSAENTLSRLSIGTVCGTSPSTAPPATFPVGEPGSIASGCSASQSAIPRTSRSYASSSSAEVPPP